ncbi:MAG: hypothetical protein Q8L81_12020 [Bacteroidota bacterium]|nr:hypothetical protein [Bacteroidota bacterium]
MKKNLFCSLFLLFVVTTSAQNNKPGSLKIAKHNYKTGAGIFIIEQAVIKDHH